MPQIDKRTIQESDNAVCPDCDNTGYASDSAAGPVPCRNGRHDAEDQCTCPLGEAGFHYRGCSVLLWVALRSERELSEQLLASLKGVIDVNELTGEQFDTRVAEARAVIAKAEGRF